MRGMGGMGGMGGLMAQAQKMQQKLAKVQEELKQTEFTGEAANGAVKVVITGGHEAAFLKAARDFSSHAERSARVRRMAPFGRRAASGGAFLYAAHFGGA